MITGIRVCGMDSVCSEDFLAFASDYEQFGHGDKKLVKFWRVHIQLLDQCDLQPNDKALLNTYLDPTVGLECAPAPSIAVVKSEIDGQYPKRATASQSAASPKKLCVYQHFAKMFQ